MLWEDLLVDRELTGEELTATLAELFGVGREDVLVVESLAALVVPTHARILCQRGTAGGDFPTRLSVYLRDPGLETMERSDFVEQFCRRLNCSCLVSDASPNPYSMLLVRPAGGRQRVYLDAERLDANEEYVVAREVVAEEGTSEADAGAHSGKRRALE